MEVIAKVEEPPENMVEGKTMDSYCMQDVLTLEETTLVSSDTSLSSNEVPPVLVEDEDSASVTLSPSLSKERRTVKKTLYPENRFPFHPLHPKEGDFEIVGSIDCGFGVICYKHIQKGEIVAAVTGDFVPEIRQHTLQVTPHVHMYDTWFTGYLLHSCEPNVHLDMENLMLYAIRDIAPNDYLFMDYAQTEDVLFKCFPCCCNTPKCRGWITGRLQMADPSDPAYQEYLAAKNAAADATSLTTLDNMMTTSATNASNETTTNTTTCWWERPDLCYDANNRLQFAGRDVETLATRHGSSSPCFFYNAPRIVDNVMRIQAALARAGFEDRSRVLYAMKANRYAPLLTYLKASGTGIGIDACSPNEVEHAISCGFEPQDISFTNTSLSQRDLERLSKIDGLNMNCDSIHAIRKWGELGPNREIGIRINPAMGIGRADNEKLQYCGVSVISKFGIYKEQLPLALATAARHNLKITRVHFHTGCGYLTPQLETWSAILEECLWFVDQIGSSVKTVNIGGGLGVPHVQGDEPLDLDAWGAVLAKHFLHRENITINVEPGDYIAKDAGILITTVNSIEKKQTKTFVGVNAGFNIALEPAVYSLPFEPVPAIRKGGGQKKEQVTIAGHINEALDIFYKDIELPPLEENDTLVLINAGAYSSSMASNHCMRGEFKEFLLV